MALVVQLKHAHAPVSTLQLRISKAVEQFYYLTLFSTTKTYDSPEVWRDWLEMGFNVAIKEAPPGTAANDKVKITVHPPMTAPEIFVEGSNQTALQRLRQLLENIEAVRPSLTGKSEDVRAETLIKGAVGKTLAQPVVDALLRHGFRPDEVDSYLTMIRRGLLALTHDEVQSVKVSLQ